MTVRLLLLALPFGLVSCNAGRADQSAQAITPAKEAVISMHVTIRKYPLKEFTQSEREPILRVASKTTADPPLARLRSPVSEKYPANQPLVLLFLGPKLDSPDVLRVKSSQRRGQDITLNLEQLDYTGDLTKNIVTRPVVEAELGTLAAGNYRVRMTITVLDFQTYDKPVAETLRGSETYTLSFTTQ